MMDDILEGDVVNHKYSGREVGTVVAVAFASNGKRAAEIHHKTEGTTEWFYTGDLVRAIQQSWEK